MLGSDSPDFNANNFELTAVESRFPFQFATSAYETDFAALVNASNSAWFFLLKQGGFPGPPFTNRHSEPLLKEIQSNGKFKTVPFNFTFPDGGQIQVFRNLWPGSLVFQGQFLYEDPPRGFSCLAHFGGTVCLEDFSFCTAGDSVRVRFRWRDLKKLDLEYLCFGHILNAEGRVLGFLDHRILSGDPPMTSWRPGSVAIEELRFRLPSGETSKPLKLRFGLYHQPTGERLKAERSGSLDGNGLTVTDQGTAVMASHSTE
ncbi:MAG: hypothetical protein L0387_11300 [Acidobacteria bacterium]|nr:hypothetical protein [Acidobacteriota bacterium]MCI0622232.1 hypothetical protein [Acidobacteriota bacterium]MCI0717950.1 hypothetical protein [Acidobacteriota bacterium]